MLKSMTGYGKASSIYQTKKITIEVRSLNSKTLDLNVRIPSIYKEIETVIRKLTSQILGRGKVDFTLQYEELEGETNTSINQDVAIKYYKELQELSTKLDEKIEDPIGLIVKMPEIFTSIKSDIEQEELDFVLALAKEALENLNEFRIKEGQDLHLEFTSRIKDIDDLLEQVPQFEDERVQIIRERMKKGLEEIENGQYDENRLEQEMIFYIEKLDVAEEKMRLKNHLTYFLETMKTEQAGKKLGFIGQEIGREINTLGSKSNHAEMQKIVINMKDNLEKMKEQILNTL